MSKNIKIAFFDSKPHDIRSFSDVNENYGYELEFLEHRLDSHSAKGLEDVDVVCAFVNDNINQKVIDRLYDSGVKLIALRCAGYNNVDLSAAYEKIHVVRVPAYSPYAVAEHNVALMLCLNRKVHKAYNKTRDNNFALKGLLGFDMYGKTIGVIGTGAIGKVLLKILKGFQANLVAYDPFPDEDYAKEVGFEYVSLEELYKLSNIISLTCPLNAQTHHMINKDSIAMMKNKVMLINTGRGGLINTIDLVEALKEKKVGSAGLDVYEEEEGYFFEDLSDKEDLIDDDVLARLLSFRNVLVTSHQAFYTKEALAQISSTTLQNVKDFFEEQKLPNEICYRCKDTNCKKKTQGKCF